jgi:hypothetical protein
MAQSGAVVSGDFSADNIKRLGVWLAEVGEHLQGVLRVVDTHSLARRWINGRRCD